MRKPRLVVVGGGVGGATAVVELRKEGFDGGITLISAENTVPYERPPLSKEFLLGLPCGSPGITLHDPAQIAIMGPAEPLVHRAAMQRRQVVRECFPGTLTVVRGRKRLQQKQPVSHREDPRSRQVASSAQGRPWASAWNKSAGAPVRVSPTTRRPSA